MDTIFNGVKLCDEDAKETLEHFLFLKDNALEPLDHLDDLSHLSPDHQSERNQTLQFPHRNKKDDKNSSGYVSSAFNSSANSLVVLECDDEDE
jgi:hypothetical protein